jgi:S1-C subfamily serine protease
MQVESLTQAKINLLRLVAEPGDIMVKKVENKSAAYEAGIKTGDIIAELDDQVIGDIDQLGLKLETLESETWVKILLYRTQKWSSTVLERKYYTGFVRVQGNDRQVEADTERVDL